MTDHQMIEVLGIDPGYASGGVAVRRWYPTNGVWNYIAIEGVPKTLGSIIDRVDAATEWFCGWINPIVNIAGLVGTTVVALESQHKAAYGASERGESNASSAWVREVVGGIRRECFRRQIPIRMIEPTQWRTALKIVPSATKKQAWNVVNQIHHNNALPKTNEHGRDAAVIAFAGSISIHRWLLDWKRARGIAEGNRK